jgi:ParB family transcriptional regulator, chromosome partitioning protein
VTKKALGKGLSALFTNNEEETEKINKGMIYELDVTKIKPNPYQPRELFKEEEISELAKSIQECGLIHPISVRKTNDKYEIIEGERRFRACKLLGFEKIPVIERELEDNKMLLVALIENLQRENLNPIEESNSYMKLMKEYDLTQQEVSDKVGKSRSYVANMVRLVNLPHMVKENLELGKIDVGHARALLTLQNHNLQRKACNIIIQKKMTVRETEKLVKNWLSGKIQDSMDKKSDRILNPDIISLETELSEKLNTRVKIMDKNNQGKIVIEYYSIEDFDNIYEKLSKQ